MLTAVWIFLAICSAASLGLANIAHKRLLDNYLGGVGVLGAGSIVTRLTCSVIVLAIVGWPTQAPALAVGIGLISGMSLGAGLALLFLGLKLGEASRAVAVSQTYPILVALLALYFLGETVSAMQWLAIMLVIGGAAVVSVEGFGRRLFRLTPGLTALVASSASLGLSFFLAEFALQDLSPWEVFGLQELGMAPVFGLFGRPSNWVRLWRGLRTPPAWWTFVIGEGSAAPIGYLPVHPVVQLRAGFAGVRGAGDPPAVRVCGWHAVELAHAGVAAGIHQSGGADRQIRRYRHDRRRDDNPGYPVTARGLSCRWAA